MSKKKSFNIADSEVYDNQLTDKTVINKISKGKISNLEFIRKSPGKYVYQDIKTKKTTKLELVNDKGLSVKFLETDDTLGDLFIDDKKRKYYLNMETRKFISLKNINKTIEDIKMAKMNKIGLVKSYSFVKIKGNKFLFCESVSFKKDKVNIFFDDEDANIKLPDGSKKLMKETKEKVILSYMVAEVKDEHSFDIKGIVTDSTDDDLVIKYPVSEREYAEDEANTIRTFYKEKLNINIR